MRIAIGLNNLCQCKGGMQRAGVTLANELSRRGHSVSVICHDYGNPPAFVLDEEIRLHFAPKDFDRGKSGAIHAVRKLLRSADTDAFISMASCVYHLLWGLVCIGTGIPFICSERIDPRIIGKAAWSKPGRHAVLASADFIIELSPAHMETIPQVWARKARVIPNAAPNPSRMASPGESNAPVVLFLSRFVPGKRALLLLEAFKFLADRYPGWKLRFCGFGPQEAELSALVKRYGLTDRVEIRIPEADVFSEFANAQIYCHPSIVEGFPNTVLEAMATGLPVVGMADCHAMRSLEGTGAAIIVDEANPQALASALATLMDSPELRLKMGKAALHQCATVYRYDHIYDLWENLLFEASALKGHTVMDSFCDEPFSSMATLSAAARREWLYRNYGDPMPHTLAWLCSKFVNFKRNFCKRLF